MPMLYRIDFFNREFEWKGYSLMPDPDLSFDYLTLDPFKTNLPGVLPIERGWYVHITSSAKKPYQGIVSAVTDDGKSTSVSVKPLLSLFDIDVITTEDNLLSAERYIADIITDVFVDSSDAVERIPGLSVSTLSDTANVFLASDSDTQNLHDVIIRALENAQITVSVDFKPMSKEILVCIKKNNSPAIKINADVAEVIDKTFSFRDDYGTVNKVIVYNKDDISERAIFYADDYAPPAVRKITSVSLGSDDTFSDKAQEAAEKELAYKDFDNCIELKYSTNCKLLPDISIGQEANVYHSGAMYTSFLTGWEISKDTTTLLFGSVRLDLTKILKLEAKR